jgi:hypothetical protein
LLRISSAYNIISPSEFWRLSLCTTIHEEKSLSITDDNSEDVLVSFLLLLDGDDWNEIGTFSAGYIAEGDIREASVAVAVVLE